MIDFKNLTKSYSGEYVLKEVNCRVNTGEKVGVVGPNGAGKSTLFGMITGEIVPDYGEVVMPKDSRLGVMRQTIAECELDRTLLDFTADAIPELKSYATELERIEARLGDAVGNEQEKLLNRHGYLQTAIEHLGAYHLDQEAKQALTSLGFPVSQLEAPLSSFSGGWRMRAALARVLISRPDILLLDEPSNYLDVPAVEWLCRFLGTYHGTLLLISHDRFLLRKLTSITFEVNCATVTRYPGNYDYYRREREQRRITLEAAKRNNDHKREQMERTIERFRAKSTKAAQAKSLQKKLDKIEEIELPNSLQYHGAIRFPQPPDAGAEAVRFEKLTFGYTPDNLLFHDFDMEIATGEKIAIIGYNGMGKTTLLKLLCGRLKPLSGRVVPGHHIVMGYQAQDFSDVLNDELSVYDAVREALPPNAPTGNVANVLGSFGFSGDAMKKPCGVLSGGEKIRLQMARIFVRPPNLLILDEPTTHLDIAARELLQEAIVQYPGTVALVSHDIDFVRGTATTIWEVKDHKVTKYFGNYDYYVEKSAQLNAASGATPAAAVINARNEENGDASPMLAKDRRRARAQARNAIAGELRKAKEEVAALEKLLDEQSARHSVICAKLASGEKLDFSKLKRELAELDKAIADTENKWEERALELEALRQENDRINEN